MSSLAVLRERLEAAEAADNGAHAARLKHVDAAIALVVALVDDLQEDEADDVLAMMAPLVTHDPKLEIDMRRRLAAGLDDARARERAIEQRRRAHACAERNKLT